MDKKPLALLLLIPFAISIAGCTTTVTGGAGVAIEEFSASEPSVTAGDDVFFRLRIKNTGTGLAEIRSITLSGAEWLERGPDSCSPLLKMLSPADDTGFAGESKNCEFQRTAPEAGLGVPQEYIAKVKVVYGYQDSSLTSVYVTGQEEARRIRDRGGTFPSTSRSAVSGPLEITVLMKPLAIGTQSSVAVPFEIKLRNTGGGIVCADRECAPENLNKAEIKIITDLQMEDCLPVTIVDLYKGYENSVTCTFTVSKFPESGFTEHIIKVESEHGYLIESQLPLTVSGKF